MKSSNWTKQKLSTKSKRSFRLRPVLQFNKKDIPLAIIVLLLAPSLFFLFNSSLENYFYANLIDIDDFAEANYSQLENLITGHQPIRNWSIPEPDIKSSTATAIEINSQGDKKILLSKNSEHPYLIASISKLMAAIVAVDSYSLDQTTIISQTAANQIGSTSPLREGDNLYVKDLISLSLMQSDNGAAYALAEIMGVHNFVREMNEKARSLGLKQTNFFTPSGLTDFNQRNNYSNASELTEMVIFLWTQPEYEIIREILRKKSVAIYDATGAFYYRSTSNNRFIGKYSSFVGGKTGYLPSAGECLISVFQRQGSDNYLVITVLGSEDRFSDTEAVINWLSQAYLYYAF
jgi:D-alanyl-D-alanine carboxypeptidase